MVSEEQRARRRARRKVEQKLAFYLHLGIYIAVNILLVVINLLTWRGYPWFIYPLVGWGVGVAIHGMVAFFDSSKKMAGFKERMIEKETERQLEAQETEKE